jgi:hypothetical protein
MSRTESARARYREQLQAFAGADVVVGAIGEAGERWGWHDHPTWRRIHERFEPDAEPYATCVLAGSDPPQRIVRVDAFRDGARAAARGACSAHRQLDKALGVARALRPDGDQKAGRRPRGALELLGEMA